MLTTTSLHNHRRLLSDSRHHHHARTGIFEEHLTVNGAVVVLAVATLAVVSAEDTCLETLTILLQTS